MNGVKLKGCIGYRGLSLYTKFVSERECKKAYSLASLCGGKYVLGNDYRIDR